MTTQVLPRFFFSMFLITIPCLFCLGTVYAQHVELAKAPRRLHLAPAASRSHLARIPAASSRLHLSCISAQVRREVRSGMYSPLPYVLAHTTLQLPMMVVLSLAALLPSGYGMMAVRCVGSALMPV